MRKLNYFIQNKISKKTKVLIPLFLTYIILLLSTIMPLPSYILIGLASISTLLVYFFTEELLKSEQYIIEEREKELSTFLKMFADLSEENKKLSGELEQFFTDFDTYVISSKTDLFGRITYASKAFQKISGYTEEEMLGSSHNILRHPDMDSSVFKEMWETIEDGNIWTGDIKNLKKDGSFYWVRTIISPIIDIDGGKIGYNSIRQDITNLKDEYSKEDRRGSDRRQKRRN